MAFMLDYSGLRLTGAQLAAARRAGVTHISRYLAPPIPACDWKRCTKAEADAIRAAGIDLILNWEWYESRLLEGAPAGRQDGQWALAAAKGLGYPKGATIYCSCDTDTNNTYAVLHYLRAFSAALGGYYKVDIYGGYTVVQACLNAGVARYGWQTLAWSYGKIGGARLYQNGKYWFGRSADENTVRKAPVGAWAETDAAKPVVTPPHPKPKPTPAPTPVVPTHTYVVRPGDTLTMIALRYHTTVAQLVKLNRAKHPTLIRNRNIIEVGWKITVPGAAVPPVAPPAKFYVVHDNDTLAGIAAHFHTTVPTLVRLNTTRFPSLKKNPNLIRAGWDLRVAA